jgi:hypothetical protein
MADTPEEAAAPLRTVRCGEALEWLRAQPVLGGHSFITSLPDVSELGLPLEAWRRWFVEAAALVLARCPGEGLAIFYQTDVLHEGMWLDKSYLIQKAAEQEGSPLRWHRIVCRRPPGALTFSRPAYTHLLCFSRGVRADPGRPRVDVLPETGRMIWPRAMGLEACLIACREVLAQTATRAIVDPFCGQGSVLAVANALGLAAIGVERSRKRCRAAEALRVVLTEDGPRVVAPPHLTEEQEGPEG